MINVNYGIIKEVNIKKKYSCFTQQLLNFTQMYLQFSFESNGPNVTS